MVWLACAGSYVLRLACFLVDMELIFQIMPLLIAFNFW